MENLKNNIQDITKDGEKIVNSYVKLFGMRQSQKLAVFLGVLATVFIISTLLLIIVVFGSIVLANYLSDVLESNYMGYLIITGLYLLVIAMLLLIIKKSGRPLLANLFLKFVMPLLGVEINQEETFDGLNKEKDMIESKIKADKSMMEVHAQLLKYSALEDFIGVIAGLFKSKKKQANDEAPNVKE